jgi:CheY-like chemotaxis protein/two-component sensor histidine kinase
MMDRQLVHVVRLIDDLLDVSRVSQGKIELRKDTIEVAAVVRAAVEGSRPLIDAGHHSLIIDLPGQPIWLEADLTRLAQVLGNLLNNAAKYTPEGGHIGLSVEAVGDSAVIAVSDDGVGIPAEMQSGVFELFAQVDNHLDRAGGGLGIGLALVRQLVTLHGGTVEVQSAGVGQGSKFTVRVPRTAPPELKAEAEVAQPPPSRSLKILVVDDNVEVAEISGLMLEEIGHTYRIIHDGRQALETAKDFRPDAILLDIGLPGMDGYAVCRALRQDDAFKRTPIIAQTGWGQDRDKMQSSEAGFDHHLVKPVTLKDLERLLANLGPH